MKKLLTLTVLLISTLSLADTVEVIKTLHHSNFNNFITTAYTYDKRRNIVCMSATATRYSGGATIATSAIQVM